MMHYAKGENVEKEVHKEDLPFDDFITKEQKEFLWMHVKGGTKTSNVINFAKKALENNEYRTIVWSGTGGGVVKTVSCAEILKRDFPLYQVTRMSSSTVEEHWKPQMEGLDELVVTRKTPSLHILMSLDAIPDGTLGLQKPNTKTDFFECEQTKPESSQHKKKPRTDQQRQNQSKPYRKPHQQQQQKQQQQADESGKSQKQSSHKRSFKNDSKPSTSKAAQQTSKPNQKDNANVTTEQKTE